MVGLVILLVSACLTVVLVVLALRDVILRALEDGKERQRIGNAHAIALAEVTSDAALLARIEALEAQAKEHGKAIKAATMGGIGR